MVKCRPELRPHKMKGIEIVLWGDCETIVEEIMNHLGPYGQQYLKRRLVYEEEAESTKKSDTPSK